MTTKETPTSPKVQNLPHFDHFIAFVFYFEQSQKLQHTQRSINDETKSYPTRL